MIIRTGKRTFVNTENVQSITIERGGTNNSKWCACLWYVGVGCQTHEFDTEEEAQDFAGKLLVLANYGEDEDDDDDYAYGVDEYEPQYDNPSDWGDLDDMPGHRD